MENHPVIITQEGDVATIWLNREKVRNAFNEAMIAGLLDTLKRLDSDPSVRVLLIRGKGSVFCAGADLNWMQKAVDYSFDQNYQESLQLANMLHTLYSFSKPTIAIVHGAAIGGGIGLLSTCDFVFSSQDTKFSFSEVKLGLIPAVISPYAIKRIGEKYAKQMMLTGKVFMEEEALKIGLVDFIGTPDDIISEVQKIVKLVSDAGPDAVSQSKQLVSNVVNHWSLEEAMENTAKLIAEVRSTEEAQKRMRSFLEK